jgi:hypothetical protein
MVLTAPCVLAAESAALVMIRHGESLWNAKNLFTGCVDVPLSQQGISEALEAGTRIADIPVDIIFVSALMRAQMTAMIAMTQHKRAKVSPPPGSLPAVLMACGCAAFGPNAEGVGQEGEHGKQDGAHFHV